MTVVKQTPSCTFTTEQVTRHIIFMIIMLPLCNTLTGIRTGHWPYTCSSATVPGDVLGSTQHNTVNVVTGTELAVQRGWDRKSGNWGNIEEGLWLLWKANVLVPAAVKRRAHLRTNLKKKRKQLILARSLIARIIFLLRTLIITCIKYKMGNVCKKMGSSRTRTIKEEKGME